MSRYGLGIVPRRKTYQRWSASDVAKLTLFGPHTSTRDLAKLIGYRHPPVGISKKLQRLGILRTTERLAKANKEGRVEVARRSMCCGDCGSRNLVATSGSASAPQPG